MSWLAELKKPTVAISIALGVAGVSIGVFSYIQSQREAVPTYLIDSKPSKIFDSAWSSPRFSLVDTQAEPVTGDVYVVNATFWNSGNVPIEPTEVRIPVRLVVDGARRILDHRIFEQTRPKVSEFRLTPDPTDSNAVVLSWTHLDPGFGVRFHVVYETEPGATTSAKFDGYIVDAAPFLNSAPFIRSLSAVQLVAYFAVFFVVILAGSLLLGIKLVAPAIIKLVPAVRFRRVVLLVVGLVVGGAFGYGSTRLVALLLGGPTPPF